jgi:hypothetical protein
MSHAATVPERILFDVIKLGLDTVESDNATALVNESEIDRILAYLDAAERAKVRTIWGTNPPTLVAGFAREDHPFPVYSLTLASDDDLQQYLDDGGHQLDVLDAELMGIEQDEYTARETGAFQITCFHEHPDLCTYMYRIMRRVIRVGTRKLIMGGLQDPRLRGADMAPWQSAKLGNLLFSRKIVVTCEYHETWLSTGPLWAAMNGQTERAYDPDQISVHHEDQVAIPGGVSPFFTED